MSAPERPATHKPARRAQKHRPVIQWKLEVPVLTAIFAASLAIRLYLLGSFPDTILGDEADTVQNAALILYGRAPLSRIFGLDWSQNSAFSVYKLAAFLAVFGFTSMAMRLPSALISALALVPFYFLLRRQVAILPASLATILLSTELWYLHFSRSGWILIDTAFYMLMSMLLLMLAIDEVNAGQARARVAQILFGLAGLFCCLGLYGYTAGRSITVAIAAFFPVALAFTPGRARALMRGFLILFAVEIVLFAPQAVTAARDWQRFNLRTGVVFIVNSPAFKADPLGTMLLQMDRNLRGPWDGSVNNTPQYTPVGEPQLNPVTGVLVLIGIILSVAVIAYRRQPETWLWWLMLLAFWCLTQVATVNTPNGARGIGYVPTLLYFSALSLDWVDRRMVHTAGRWLRPSIGRWSAAALLVTLVAATSACSILHYVSWQSSPSTRIARYPYLTAVEFPQWAAYIKDRAVSGQGATNLHVWRSIHPLVDLANPSGGTQ